MRPGRGPALACIVLLLCGTARAAPPMWRVTGRGGSAVLFGSIHLLPPRLDWRTPELDAAIAGADELWFEIPIGVDSDARAAKLLHDRGSLSRGDTLAARLSPDMLRRVNEDAVRFGLAPDAMDRMRPWLADATLSVAADARSGAIASEGVERRVDALAPSTARRHALESAADQIAVLAEGSLAEQVALLGVTLDEIDKEPDKYEALVTAWTSGDIARLRREALDPLIAASATRLRRPDYRAQPAVGPKNRASPEAPRPPRRHRRGRSPDRSGRLADAAAGRGTSGRRTGG